MEKKKDGVIETKKKI